MHLFVAILENGRHLGFSIYQSDSIYLITIEMSHAKCGACIKIGTIHPKMRPICSTVRVLQHAPMAMLQHAPTSSRSRNL